MTVFFLHPDRKQGQTIPSDGFFAQRPWWMPHLTCPACRHTWAVRGLAYPTVSLGRLSFDATLFAPVTVDLDAYQALRALVAPLLPAELPVPPGTGFGPLVGISDGATCHFVWPNPWTLLIRREVYIELAARGVQMPALSLPQFECDHGSGCDLLELQIEPRAHLSLAAYASVVPIPCSTCGRDGREVEEFILERKSVPADADLFRICELPARIVATERFRDAVRALNCTNILFSEVEAR